LASIKVVRHIENPPFYSMLVESGAPVNDFAQGGGITFIDTILISEQRTPPGPVPLSLVFHELVHAEGGPVRARRGHGADRAPGAGVAPGPEGIVFPRAEGGIFSRDTMYEAWQRSLEEGG
jgi:hypothetical protein